MRCTAAAEATNKPNLWRVESLKLLSFQVDDDTRYFERKGFVAHVGLALRVILGTSITYVELRS